MAIRASIEREKVLDYRAGIIVSTIFNVAPKKKRTKALEPQDFFPSLKPAPRIQSPTQQRNALTAIAMASGARIIRIPMTEIEVLSGVD